MNHIKQEGCDCTITLYDWLSGEERMFIKVRSWLQNYVRSVENKFTAIYNDNGFQGAESKSGVGSNLIQTAVIRRELPKLLAEVNSRILLDAPCGDFFWLNKVSLPVEKYIGVDVVKNLIKKNNELYHDEQRSFVVKNIIKDDLPKADIILCRDCLVHLTFNQAMKALRNFKKSGSRYILTTTFTERLSNEDLGSGFWRPLNLQMAPFNFPAPSRVVSENCTEADGKFMDKCLALWQLDDLRI